MIAPLFTLGLALCPLWIGCRTTDDVIHVALLLNCLFFLCLSLFTSPWPLQVLILVGMLGLSRIHVI